MKLLFYGPLLDTHCLLKVISFVLKIKWGRGTEDISPHDQKEADDGAVEDDIP